MGPFSILWFGQLISFVGSGMTKFAAIVWLWSQGGSATAVTLMAVAAFLPRTVLSPTAGALVDRWPRRLVLQLLSA
jgi:MFS family permease